MQETNEGDMIKHHQARNFQEFNCNKSLNETSSSTVLQKKNLPEVSTIEVFLRFPQLDEPLLPQYRIPKHELHAQPLRQDRQWLHPLLRLGLHIRSAAQLFQLPPLEDFVTREVDGHAQISPSCHAPLLQYALRSAIGRPAPHRTARPAPSRTWRRRTPRPEPTAPAQSRTGRGWLIRPSAWRGRVCGSSRRDSD